jgi:hypothetical protein
MKSYNDVKSGLRVRITHLGNTQGMVIHGRYLRTRRLGATGRTIGWIPGHGGDVWGVEHDDGTVAAYCINEFEAVGEGGEDDEANNDDGR